MISLKEKGLKRAISSAYYVHSIHIHTTILFFTGHDKCINDVLQCFGIRHFDIYAIICL